MKSTIIVLIQKQQNPIRSVHTVGCRECHTPKQKFCMQITKFTISIGKFLKIFLGTHEEELGAAP